MINISDNLKEKLKQMPMKPGIYKMIDSKGNIIYVGKSKCLNKRVRTYFADTPKWEKVTKMAHLIDDIEYIVTDTHLEARLLECNLIKQIKPIFNSQMKHDRGYVYLKIESFNRYRALSVVDSREGNSYGPFRRKSYLNEIINSFKNLYPIIKTDESYSFEYHLFPVCMSTDEFNKNRSSLEEILTEATKADLFIKELTDKMKKEASVNNFEMALMYKDIIENINYLKISINKYRELSKSHVLLTIPYEGGFKLFYIAGGKIIKKGKYEKITQSIIDLFLRADLTSPDISFDMDEKSFLDFKDIIYSEIVSLPESIVKIL